LSPRAFPLKHFTANPPVVRGFVSEANLQPPYNASSTAVGWVNGYRDGLVHRQLSNREVLLEVGAAMIKVLPDGLTFMGFAAGKAGANDLVTQALDELAKWSAQQSTPGADPISANAPADNRKTFSFAFLDLVETHLLKVSLSGLQRLNNNFKADGGRDLDLILEDAQGQRRRCSVVLEGEKLEVMQAAFTTARVRAEIAWLTKEIETEMLGPAFWPELFSQHAAALGVDQSQPKPEAMAKLLEIVKEARKSGGLTEAKLAAMVLERMSPTLAGLRQVPAWDPKGKSDLELLAENANQP
jgi:hypothetical protein